MRALRLHRDDDVLIALVDLPPDEACDDQGLIPRQVIPAGHKIATHDIAAGKPVRKYGQIIGEAAIPIAAGDHVHSHNLIMTDHGLDERPAQAVRPLPPPDALRTFDGYHRESGKIGTRNYLGILTTVNCSGSVARFIAEAFIRDGSLAAYPNIDGIVPIVHDGGCGLASQGESYEVLRRTLAGYANHPNFGGVLLVGLGCEVMQLSSLASAIGVTTLSLGIQDCGGTRASVKKGVAMLHQLAGVADKARRAPAPASALVLGMQCGGSDGYSGITANPALGVASDLLVRQGGTSILSETPEIFGAEHLLIRRSVDAEVARALQDRIAWWEDYSTRHGAKLDNNPSPGNKEGGLTTILEKSLGSVAKSGTAPLSGVYLYAQPVDKPGFVFMDSPGYDPCSATGQIASGANLIAFTTGRGSVSGFKPVPGLKLATTSGLYERMNDDMDINCGDILDGVSLADKGAEIFESLLEVASGRRTKSEELGFGEVEFVPWHLGAVL